MDEQLTDEQIVALRERQNHLINVISAINGLEQNSDWATLKKLLFQPMVENIKLRIMQESLRPEIDTKKIYTLQGEMNWARRYTDFRGYAEELMHELEAIKGKLKVN